MLSFLELSCLTLKKYIIVHTHKLFVLILYYESLFNNKIICDMISESMLVTNISNVLNLFVVLLIANKRCLQKYDRHKSKFRDNNKRMVLL